MRPLTVMCLTAVAHETAGGAVAAAGVAEKVDAMSVDVAAADAAKEDVGKLQPTPRPLARQIAIT